MSMNQHELETAHSQALLDALGLKRSELELDYDDKCTVLARAKFDDAMERVVQIKVRGIERYGDGGKEGEEVLQELKDNFMLYARFPAAYIPWRLR